MDWKPQKEKKMNKILLTLAILFIGSGCSGGSSSGTLSLGLTDSVNENYQAVYVTIDEVQVHRKGEAQDSEQGWLSLPDYDGPQTIDLLKLRDGVVSGLGSINLETGEYTQIRLIIGTSPDALPNIQCHSHPFANYVIDGDGNALEMKVPSGEQTGVKVVCAGLCDINENQTTELILDFDAEKSVVVAGNSGNINLKPTIKVLTADDFTLLLGTVQKSPNNGEDGEAATPLSGAVVSAQIFNPNSADLKDEVRVISKTSTNSNGEFRLLLKPGEYNLVATAEGHAPHAMDLNTSPGEVLDPLINLSTSSTGTVNGTVNIAGITEPTYALLSFRQGTTLAGELIEVESMDVLSGNSYSTGLPTEPTPDYQVVASACEKTTQENDITVPPDGILNLDIIFP